MVKSQDSLETEDFDEPSSLQDLPPARNIRPIRKAPRARPEYQIPSDDILLQTLADKQRKFNLFQTILKYDIPFYQPYTVIIIQILQLKY